MRFQRIVIPIAVFVLITAGAFAAYQVSETSRNSAAHTPQTTTNETLTQEIGLWQYVDAGTATYTTGFNDTVTVYNSTDAELTAGEDYQWNATEGTIKFLDTPQTADGETANITYEYNENTEAVKDANKPLSTITKGIGLMPLAAGGISLTLILLAFARIVAKSWMDNSPTSNR